MKLLSVEAARQLMLQAVSPLESERVALDGALGRVLSEAVEARRDQPPFNAASMDGYAVRSSDTPGRLKLIGESAAGRGFPGPMGRGETVRIFTGAALPAGADAVVIQEEVERDGDHALVPRASAQAHIRPVGQDFRAGQKLLAPGARLDPWRIALIASAGRGGVAVTRRPKVAILSTGEEIAPAGGEPGPFQIFNSGGPALAALVADWGAEAASLAPVRDDSGEIADAVERAPGDLLVTLGGASVGDHDLVKPALVRLGLVLKVESIAVRPGKPTWFGVLSDGRPVLGLPGNPASALVCAELFLRPLLLALQGADPGPRLAPAPLGLALPPNGPREHWMRAKDGASGVVPFSDQDSSLVSVFAQADRLVRRPANAPAAGIGDLVETIRLQRL